MFPDTPRNIVIPSSDTLRTILAPKLRWPFIVASLVYPSVS